MLIKDWTDVLTQSFQDLWLGVIDFVPNLIIALAIFVIGWVVGSVLGRVVAQVVKSLKVDNALRSAGLDDIVSRAGFDLDSGKFLGSLIKWFVIVVFLVAALDVLRLAQVNVFLQEVVLLYLPQVIVAVLILLVAAVIAEVMQNVVIGAAKAAHMSSAHFLGSVTKWAIWVFAILAALNQLGVASAFVQTLFTGIVVAVSLALGLSFGLGGQDSAARYLDKIRGEISQKSK
jgi:small-conductance mechanosensitive channel